MDAPNAGLEVTLGIVVGTLLGSFASPMKRIRHWQWEHVWTMGIVIIGWSSTL
jgi:hypothetical protein